MSTPCNIKVLTPTKAIPPLVGVDTYQSSISFGRCQHLVPTLGVDTYQSEYHLGRCQHPVLTLGVNTYLKENAEWQPVKVSRQKKFIDFL